MAPQTLQLCQAVRSRARVVPGHGDAVRAARGSSSRDAPTNAAAAPHCRCLPYSTPKQTRTATRQPQLERAECWQDAVDEAIGEFERTHKRRATYTICYY